MESSTAGDTPSGPEMQPGGRPSATGYGRRDLAQERTTLASERTLLAWYRTSFGAYALAVGIGNVVPSLTKSSETLKTAYAVVGVCFALVGVAAAVVGVLYFRRLHAQLPDLLEANPGKSARLSLFGAFIAILGLAIASLIFIEGIV